MLHASTTPRNHASTAAECNYVQSLAAFARGHDAMTALPCPASRLGGASHGADEAARHSCHAGVAAVQVAAERTIHPDLGETCDASRGRFRFVLPRVAAPRSCVAPAVPSLVLLEVPKRTRRPRTYDRGAPSRVAVNPRC